MQLIHCCSCKWEDVLACHVCETSPLLPASCVHQYEDAPAYHVCQKGSGVARLSKVFDNKLLCQRAMCARHSVVGRCSVEIVYLRMC